MRRTVGAALAVLAVAATVQVLSPGVARAADCITVDMQVSPEKVDLLTDLAKRFNDSDRASLDGQCINVHVVSKSSGEAASLLADDWPNPKANGPRPVVWSPASSAWGQVVNQRRADAGKKAIAPAGTPLQLTPLVIAMPKPMAEALGYPNTPLGYSDIFNLARNPDGWGAYGHPEWGRFRLGKGNPNWSTTGLDQTIASDSSPVGRATSPALERSVAYYGDTTQAYFDNWKRLGALRASRALTYLSAAVTDERSVVAYNTGHEQDDVALTAHAPRPAVQLVAVYPKDATIGSDNPIIVLDASWSSPTARKGARLFTRFALQSATQTRVAAAGFRPARGTVRTDLVAAANGVETGARTNAVAPASPLEIERALADWQINRRPAQVLFLFDVSDSMGDPADPANPPDPDDPTKLALAQAAMPSALEQLAPRDDFGLRIFTTKIPGPGNPNWRDLVPMGPIATKRKTVLAAVTALTRQQGSPLYTATRDAFDAVARNADPQRINAVVLLTDGYNEDDHDNDKAALLAHLAKNPNVPVFTIAYSADADSATLEDISAATNARSYDASDTTDLADQLSRTLASL